MSKRNDDYNPGRDSVNAARERRAWQAEVIARQADRERRAQPFPKTAAEIRRIRRERNEGRRR